MSVAGPPLVCAVVLQEDVLAVVNEAPGDGGGPLLEVTAQGVVAVLRKAGSTRQFLRNRGEDHCCTNLGGLDRNPGCTCSAAVANPTTCNYARWLLRRVRENCKTPPAIQNCSERHKKQAKEYMILSIVYQSKL